MKSGFIMTLLPVTLLLSLGFAPSPSLAQAASDQPVPTFRTEVRSVLVDVEVYDGNGYTSRGEPVDHLRESDFEVYEKGKRQTITSFEAHVSRMEVQPLEEQRAPPDSWTNAPSTGDTEDATVILIDPGGVLLDEQAWMLAQVRAYFKGAAPGHLYAILALSTQLEVVEDFTRDPARVLAAMEARMHGARPTVSAFAQGAAEQQVADGAATMAREGSAEAMAEQLGRFQQQMRELQGRQKTVTTLDAFQQIARYLAGVRGRKNLIWLSRAFPEHQFGSDLDFGDEVKQATNLLAEARVSVYPVEAEGLAADDPGMNTSMAGVHNAQSATALQVKTLTEASQNKNWLHLTMDDIAARTGGEAFYNTNGLTAAIDRVVNAGEHYYTLSYTPHEEPRQDGAKEYRKMRVVLKGHSRLSYRLAYRRGYYLEDRTKLLLSRRVNDPLVLLMQPAMPNFSQIIFKLQAVLEEPPRTGTAVAGDNSALDGHLIRYRIRLAVPVAAMSFPAEENGVRHGDFRFELLAFNQQGSLMNWVTRRLLPVVRPAQYESLERSGLQLTQELDLPPGVYYLRAGVYDQATGHAGTLEVPLVHTPAGLVRRSSAAALQPK